MNQIVTGQKVWFVTGMHSSQDIVASSLHGLFNEQLCVGCSSGIGRQIALTALERGDKVVATARSLASIQDLESNDCKLVQLDITEETFIVNRAAQQAIQAWGRVDVVVNNAGHRSEEHV